jgi:dCTP deaminase
MFLSAEEIAAEVEAGSLGIAPFDPVLLKPNSYVLRLGSRFRRWLPSTDPIDPWSPDASARHLAPVEHLEELVLESGAFLLAETLERISMPRHLVGQISTLSHWGRLGLTADHGSWLVSAGFGAVRPTPLTLELYSTNPAPLRLRVGAPICHLAYVRSQSQSGASLPLANSVYEGLGTPSAPCLYEEFHKLVRLAPVSEGTLHGACLPSDPSHEGVNHGSQGFKY